MNIKELIGKIAETYKFDEASYPGKIVGKTPEEVLHFSISHGLLHINKSVGKVATELEKADHGGKMDPLVLEEAIAKLTINALRMCELVGVSEDTLLLARKLTVVESALTRTGH